MMATTANQKMRIAEPMMATTANQSNEDCSSSSVVTSATVSNSWLKLLVLGFVITRVLLLLGCVPFSRTILMILINLIISTHTSSFHTLLKELF